MINPIKFRKRRHPMAGLVLACALLPMLALVGCARNRQAVKPLSTTVLIMPFEVPAEMVETPYEVEGWWMGTHSQHQNPNTGEIFAEALTHSMRQQMGDYVNLYSRLHIRQYLARKRKLLEKRFPELDEERIDELMRQVSPQSFAQELGADRVLTGRIVKARTFVQRFLKYWTSSVEVEARLLDVDTGGTLWTDEAKKTGRWDSQKSVMEDMADSMARRLEKEFFLNPSPPEPQP